MRRATMLLNFFLLFSITCFPALSDLTGKWKGSSDTGHTVLLDLKSEGQKLSGTVTVDQGKAQEISEGKIEGDAFSFKMPSLYGNSILTVKGKLQGEELEIEIEREGGDLVAKLRAKKQ